MTNDLLDTMVKEEIKNITQNLSIGNWANSEKMGKLRKGQYWQDTPPRKWHKRYNENAIQFGEKSKYQLQQIWLVPWLTSENMIKDCSKVFSILCIK